MKKLLVLIPFLFLFIGKANSQAHVLAFGLEYKPIIPTNIFGAGKILAESDSSSFNVWTKQKYGNVIGGVVRVGFNRFLSLETGIDFVMRSYKTEFNVPDSNIFAVNDFRVVSYQIPIRVLVYIRLSDMFHMNVALGTSAAFFPSNISTITESSDNTKMTFEMEGLRKGWIQGTFDANVGFELRTKKIGYFYLGASYQLPYTHIMDLAYEYRHSGDRQDLIYTRLNGSYLTADIRYFFPENPAKKKKWEEQKRRYNQEQQRRKALRKARKEAKQKRKAGL